MQVNNATEAVTVHIATIVAIMRSENEHPHVNITEMADVSSLITRVLHVGWE